jgi:6-phosphofructo-2-kinase
MIVISFHNLNLGAIWLTRHGESEYNLENRIGGDPVLTPSGRKYASALSKFIQERHPAREEDTEHQFSILTSTLRRTIESVSFFDPQKYNIQHIRTLNEIYAGSCETLSYEKAEELYPTEFATRAKNKLFTRFPGPGGECYADVIDRLQPLIVELERMELDTLLVTHQAVMVRNASNK